MSAKEEIQSLQWKVRTTLTFNELAKEADEVFGARDLPANRVQRAFTAGTFRTAKQNGVSIDYRIEKALPPGHGVVRISYTSGPEAAVQYTIIDSDLTRQRLRILLVPIPISPWYAPAMAEFRDTSARLRRRVSA